MDAVPCSFVACINRLLVSSARSKEAVALRDLSSGEGLRSRAMIPTCPVSPVSQELTTPYRAIYRMDSIGQAAPAAIFSLPASDSRIEKGIECLLPS